MAQNDDSKAPQIEEVVRTAGFPTKTAVCSSNLQPDANELSLLIRQSHKTKTKCPRPETVKHIMIQNYIDVPRNQAGLKLTRVLLWPISGAFRALRSTPPEWLATPFGGAKLDSRDAKAKCNPECWSPNSASIAARITSNAFSKDSLPAIHGIVIQERRNCLQMFKIIYIYIISIYFNEQCDSLVPELNRRRYIEIEIVNVSKVCQL